jgi:hypothetical protein
MPIKIFQAGGKEAIEKMEAEINKWLARLAAQRAKHLSTAACSVKDSDSDEVFQHLILTFLYD